MKLSCHSPRAAARRACHGILLIECLTYCTIFFIISGLAMSAFYRAREQNRDLRRCADDIVRAMQAGERWRADVRAATGRPQVDEFNGQLVLHLPHAAGETAYSQSNGAVWRRATTNAAWEIFLPRVAASRMQPDARERVAAWRWELELATAQTNARVRPLFTFQAVVPPEAKR